MKGCISSKWAIELIDVEQTRGHNNKLRKHICKINERNNYFSNRVVDVLNNLPQEAVSAKSVRVEIALDNYWEIKKLNTTIVQILN